MPRKRTLRARSAQDGSIIEQFRYALDAGGMKPKVHVVKVSLPADAQGLLSVEVVTAAEEIAKTNNSCSPHVNP